MTILDEPVHDHSPPASTRSHDVMETLPPAQDISGRVWIVLFSIVIGLSVGTNLLMTVGIASNRRKHTFAYLLLVFLFVINCIDYSLLIFEFTLGLEHVFPFGETACMFYQCALKGTPVLQACTLLVLAYYTISTRQQSDLWLLGIVFLGLVFVECVFSIPTAYFSNIVIYQSHPYCEIDLGYFNAHPRAEQVAISVYYLFYLAAFSFWLPLVASLPAVSRLSRLSRTSTKFPEASVVLCTVGSFFIFHLLHALIVLGRHSVDAVGVPITKHQSWMIKVAQSLSLLIAYFWHFIRPVLVLLIDPDLKHQVTDWFRSQPPAQDDLHSQSLLRNNGNNKPIV